MTFDDLYGHIKTENALYFPGALLNKLKHVMKRKDELSVQDDCLMWGGREVVPLKLQRKVMEALHSSYPGIFRMKSLARQHVWWPGIDAALEKKVKECNTCQATRHTLPVALLHPWEWPKQPWQRVHADYAGPFLGKMFLILFDAYSKWVDIHVVSRTC